MSAQEQKPAPKPTPLKTLRLLVGKREGEKPPVFRPEQKKVVDQILKGRDALAILPTGMGKTVCYQVPALHLPGLTLVITPLLALMRDQVERLHGRMKDHVKALCGCDYPVACLSSDFLFDHDGFFPDRDREEGEDQEEDRDEDRDPPPLRARRNQIFLDAVQGKYKLLYVTPERLRHGAFIRFARRVSIAMIVVDEAHCISLWGHDFRRQYLEIRRLMTRTGQRPILAAFTATATQAVREDIIQLMDMRIGQHEVVEPLGREGRLEPRKELRFFVQHFPDDASRLHALLEYLRGKRGKEGWQSGFVYCRSKREVHRVYEHLSANGLPVTCYHAQLDDPKFRDRYKKAFQLKGESKAKNLNRFLSGERPIVVSTSALGMGIDKPDVRFVVHYGLPLSLEDYYQQAGRAGRDGNLAECALYYIREHRDEKSGKPAGDLVACRNLIWQTFQDSDLPLQSRILHCYIACRRLGHMLDYAEGDAERSSEALQGQILDYFRDFHIPLQDRQRREVLAELKAIDVLYVNRTKVAQDLRKKLYQKPPKGMPEGVIRGEGLVVSPASGKDPALTVSYQVTPPPGERLSYLDLMVADAVYTLMQHRVSPIRPSAVLQLLSGNRDLTVEATRRKRINESIRKLTLTDIRIDRTGSLSYGFTYPDQGNPSPIEGPFLPLKETPGKGFSYDPANTPPLYQYAEILNGQFFSFPLRHLRTKKPAGQQEEVDASQWVKTCIPLWIMSLVSPDPSQVARLVTAERKSFDASDRNLIMIHSMLCRIGAMPISPDPTSSHGLRDCTMSFDAILRTTGIRQDIAAQEPFYRRRTLKTLETRMEDILKHFLEVKVIGRYVIKTPPKKDKRASQRGRPPSGSVLIYRYWEEEEVEGKADEVDGSAEF